MLSIERVETIVVRLPPRADFRWLSLSRPLGEFVLARIEADGIEGWGEVVGLRDWGDADGRRHGETPGDDLGDCARLARARADRAAVRSGRALGALDTVVVGNPYAKALLDIAPHDLVGRRAGLPAYALLGGASRRAIPVAHMLGIMSEDEATDEGQARSPTASARCRSRAAGRRRDIALIRAAARGAARRHLAAARRQRRLHGDHAVARARRARGRRRRPRRTAAARARRPGGRASRSDVPVMADEACWTPADALCSSGGERRRAVALRRQGGRLARSREMASSRARRSSRTTSTERSSSASATPPTHVALASPAELLPCVIPVNAPAGATTTTAGRYFEDDVIAHRSPTRTAPC